MTSVAHGRIRARQAALAPLARRPRLAGTLALLAIAGVLLAFQPLRGPWWLGDDFDSVYAASALTLFSGEPTQFYDHPGMPLQQALAASFTVGWALSSDESRAEQARIWLWNLDEARPYLRGLAIVLYAVSALIVFFVVTAAFRSAGWGLLGGLLFLGVPELLGWIMVVRPDGIVSAVAVASVGLAVLGVRRHSAALLLAAAFVAGFAVSLKIPGVALAAPLALAVLLAAPRPEWSDVLRRPVLLAAGAFLLLLALTNIGAAAPDARHVRDLLAALAALAAVTAATWFALRRTRIGDRVTLGLALVWAAVAGLLVPSFLYASAPPAMVRWLGLTLTGHGVTSGSRLSLDGLDVLRPWAPMLALAVVGSILAFRQRERTWLLWATGSTAMFAVALTQARELRYYEPAVALAIPLVLRALGTPGRQPSLLAAGVVALVLVVPFRDGIDEARARGSAGDRIAETNSWVSARLRPGEVALTQEESSDSRYFYLVQAYSTAPEPPYRFLTVDPRAVEYARRHGLRVRYLILPPAQDAGATLASLGLDGRAREVPGRPGVHEVTRG